MEIEEKNTFFILGKKREIKKYSWKTVYFYEPASRFFQVVGNIFVERAEKFFDGQREYWRIGNQKIPQLVVEVVERFPKKFEE